MTVCEGNCSTSLSFRMTASSGKTTVVALRSMARSGQTVVALLTLLMATTWSEQSVEQVMSAIEMQAEGTSWMTSRTSWALVVEGTTGKMASSVTTSGIAAINVYSSVPVTGTRQSLSREDLGDVSWP
uniref:Uncharacterized protein n=1 Tax=Triticum urartu TaxID=4572 RepID=A0A8R7QCF7_TRIUA